MTNSNSLLLLVGLSMIALLIGQNKNIVEHFGMIPARTVRTEQVIEETCGPKKGMMYSVPGTFHAAIPPRQASTDYGAGLRYKMPDDQYLGTSMGSIHQEAPPTKENYGSCSNNMISSNVPQANYSASNYGTKLASLPRRQVVSQVRSEVPQQALKVNALGQMEQPECNPIVYDRFIYANQKNRNLVGADFLRGDIPITPQPSQWFSVAANPQTMLREGALAVMGGLDNNTTKELLALKSASSGGLVDTGSGVNFTVQKSMYGSTAGRGLKVSAFP